MLHITTLCIPAPSSPSRNAPDEPAALAALAAPAPAAPELQSISYLFKCRQLSEIDALYGAISRAIGQTQA